MIALVAAALDTVTAGQTTADVDEFDLDEVEEETTLSDVVNIHKVTTSLGAGWSANFELVQAIHGELDEAIVITHRALPTKITVVPTDFLSPTGETEVYLRPSPFDTRTKVGTVDSVEQALTQVEQRTRVLSNRVSPETLSGEGADIPTARRQNGVTA